MERSVIADARQESPLDRHPISPPELAREVREILEATLVVDPHTHLFAPEFGALGPWGIDELLTYHYLEAELFRSAKIRPEQYWALPKREQADLIWRALFVENSPVSEAARGVVSVLRALGLETGASTLDQARTFFREQTLSEYLPRVLELAGVESIVMTNDPLDPAEAAVWNRGGVQDARFRAALRLDRVLQERTDPTALRDFLNDWVKRMRPVYMAISLPDTFHYPGRDLSARLLSQAVIPLCRELDLPLALMIGTRRQVNPALRLAGDASGRADVRSIESLCRDFPENRFLAMLLSRENQHELCVYARKFANLMPVGCWWFLNNPSIVEEITRERLEMLGLSFIPQHSDARILEQLIYKWRNTRRTLAPILTERYRLLMEDGRAVSREEIRRDATRLLRGNFEEWIKPRGSA